MAWYGVAQVTHLPTLVHSYFNQKWHIMGLSVYDYNIVPFFGSLIWHKLSDVHSKLAHSNFNQKWHNMVTSSLFQLSELPIQAQSGFIHFAINSGMFLFWYILKLFLPILAELGFGFNGIFWILPNLADYGMKYVTIMPLRLNWHIIDSGC